MTANTFFSRLDAAASHDTLDIAAELEKFEAEERERLGLEARSQQYVEPIAEPFLASQREHTTILVCGLTMAHDQLVEAALKGLGYRIQSLDPPDNDSLRMGKEFGNRGQCNPTYFTVGHLVKTLSQLRDQGMSTEEIIDRYVFLTAGACGPCRFGMYVTEYRKALRDAGFDGFRVVLFQQQGGLKQATGEEQGLKLEPPFFVGLLKAFLLGDMINAIGYRLRPYELEEGATDRAVEQAKQHAYRALSEHTSVVGAILGARRAFAGVQVDRTLVKPKVSIIGEFWAMTTEGDGNYQLQKFLQKEGAEVDIQLLTAWILFILWENSRDTQHRMTLRGTDDAKKGLEGKDPQKKLALLWGAEKVLRGVFQSVAHGMGLHGYHLPDMVEVAEVAASYYNNDVRGGEAHMEVGKLILNTVYRKTTMTLSVKPFGCMPSSGVSDGVQSIITERCPEAIYLPIETSGDGAVNVQSRVQMTLFKARAAARREFDEVLGAYELTTDDVRETLAKLPVVRSPLFRFPHAHTTTAADAAEFVGALRSPLTGLKRWRDRRATTREQRASAVA